MAVQNPSTNCSTRFIERELREELIVVEPSQGNRYAFDWAEGRRADHPDFAAARRIWSEIFRKRDFRDLVELGLPLKWLGGADTVVIQFKDWGPITIRDCFIDITAEDFGIEIDRVAKMSIGPEAVLCDGEIVGGQLLNGVVGLFEVSRFNRRMAARPGGDFVPDEIFHGGINRTAEGLSAAVEDFIADVSSRLWKRDMKPQWESTNSRFGLCPVTNTLIRQYLLSDLDENGLIFAPHAERIVSDADQVGFGPTRKAKRAHKLTTRLVKF